MAMFLFSSNTPSAQIGDVLTVTLAIDPMHDSLNAVEGIVSYSSDILSLMEVRTPDSFVTMWAENPHEEAPGSIVFSGIAPGGFGQNLMAGNDGDFIPLFTMDFRVIAEGDALFGLSQGAALLHDGLGTPVQVYVSTGKIPVQGYRAGGDEVYVVHDQDPPLSFIPVIVRDTAFESSSLQLIFSTSDLQSGVAYYEVKSWPFSSFVPVQSPYTIPFFAAPSYTVRAVDFAGNSTVADPVYVPWSVQLFSWGILIAVFFLMCGGVVWRFRRRR